MERIDFIELPQVRWMWSTLRAVAAFRGGEGDVADPQRDGGFGDSETLGDGGEGEILGAEASRFLLFGDFASVSHGLKVPTVCDSAGVLRMGL